MKNPFAIVAYVAAAGTPSMLYAGPARTTLMTGSLEFEDGVLALMACGLVLFLPWSLRRWFSPARRKRLDRLEAADTFIRSRCRVCGGSIEFPVHGLGEWVECPHCNATTQLQKLGTIQRILFWARSCWSQRPGFNWKWASVLLFGAMICGYCAVYLPRPPGGTQRAGPSAG